MMFALDHIAVSTTDLLMGTAEVERRLGVTLAPGGQHPRMGTHNRLLGLGSDTYLEVIAIDPDATAPDHPRWFDLDRFEGMTRLTNWIVATDDLDAALADMPDGFGTPMAFTRGDLAWRMAVPETGVLPFDGVAPALIEWDTQVRPPQRLEDRGCRLIELRVSHPKAPELEKLFPLPQVNFRDGAPGLEAMIATPGGEVVL